MTEESKMGVEPSRDGPMGSAQPLTHGDWLIYPTDPVPPIPCWREFAWTYVHKDYDGPEDNRCGYAASVEACRAEIEEWAAVNCRCTAPVVAECMALHCPHRATPAQLEAAAAIAKAESR